MSDLKTAYDIISALDWVKRGPLTVAALADLDGTPAEEVIHTVERGVELGVFTYGPKDPRKGGLWLVKVDDKAEDFRTKFEELRDALSALVTTDREKAEAEHVSTHDYLYARPGK